MTDVRYAVLLKMSDPEKRTPIGNMDLKYNSRYYDGKFSRLARGEVTQTVISILSNPSRRFVVTRSIRVPMAFDGCELVRLKG